MVHIETLVHRWVDAHRTRILGAVSPSDVNRSLVPSVAHANIDAAIATIFQCQKKTTKGNLGSGVITLLWKL